MNLSCGNCKTIRAFSGQPPTCDECGWVCTPTAMRNIPVLESGQEQTGGNTRPYLEAYGTNPPKSEDGLFVGLAKGVGCLLLLLFWLIVFVVGVAVVKWAFEELSR